MLCLSVAAARFVIVFLRLRLQLRKRKRKRNFRVNMLPCRCYCCFFCIIPFDGVTLKIQSVVNCNLGLMFNL
jgi:hypothetical protein